MPAYLLIAFLSVGSVIEVLVSAWPPHVRDFNWRLSVLNSSAGATGTELLAILLLIVVAYLSSSTAGLWTAVSYSLVAALGYLGAAVLFGLDSLQLRARIPDDQLGRFDVTVVWALARFGFAALACLLFAACALSLVRARRRETAPANRLVVGTGAPPVARLDTPIV